MSSNMNDLISIALPFRNTGKFINHTLSSILSQDYKNIELILLDDFSDDESSQICLEFTKCNKRIRYYRNNEQRGIENCLLKIITELSSGRYFVWAHPYGIWESNYLSKCIQKLRDNQNGVLVQSSINIVDSKEININRTVFPTEITGNNVLDRVATLFGSNSEWYLHGIIVKDLFKEALIKIRNLNYSLNIAFELLLHGEFLTLDETLFTVYFPGIYRIDKNYSFLNGNSNRVHTQLNYLNYTIKNSNFDELMKISLKRIITKGILFKDISFFEKIFLSEQIIPFTKLLEGSNESTYFNELRNRINFNTHNRIIFNIIEEIFINIKAGRLVYIWGTGESGKKTRELLKSKNINIEGFIDNNKAKWDTTLYENYIYPPSFLADLLNKKLRPYIIIGSMYIDEISDQLKKLGFYEGFDFDVNLQRFV